MPLNLAPMGCIFRLRRIKTIRTFDQTDTKNFFTIRGQYHVIFFHILCKVPDFAGFARSNISVILVFFAKHVQRFFLRIVVSEHAG